MKKRNKILTFGIISSLLFSGLFYINESVNAEKSEKKEKEEFVFEETKEEVSEKMIPEATVLNEPTKDMWENALSVLEASKNKNTDIVRSLLNDPDTEQQVEKWTIRIIMENEVSGNKIDVYEAQKAAEERVDYENAWLNIAVENYGVLYTDKEVDKWIENGPAKYPVPAMLEQAEALNLTLEELNYVYDRDFYVKWVVWEKLYPILAKKYNVDLNAEYDINEPSPNTLLVDYYDSEVKEFLSKNK